MPNSKQANMCPNTNTISAPPTYILNKYSSGYNNILSKYNNIPNKYPSKYNNILYILFLPHSDPTIQYVF